jgi:RecA-family ATPase
LITQAHRSFDAIGGNDNNSDSVIETMPSTWCYEDKTVYLVDELIMEGAITLWSGESGDGKSTLALALAAAVAQGRPFLGRTVIQRPVLYMDRENPIATVKDRVLRLRIP